tara:strand:- start:307 stop:1605 length:1299 start_codon:yes stop_codon:yes gene_type:complete
MTRIDTDTEITILGGGLAALYAAYKLKSQDIILLHSANKIGGLLNGSTWKNFYIDTGCHFFDGNEKQFEFYQTVGKTKIHKVKYGSVNTGKFTDEIATPEINQPKFVEAALKELLNEDDTQLKKKNPTNLEEKFTNIFGKTAGLYMSDIQKKFTGMDSKELNASEFHKLSIFNRLRIGNDVLSNKLKNTNSYLDKIICSSLQSRGLGSYQISMYPEEYGTSGFVKNAIEYFSNNDVSIFNEFKINKILDRKDFFEIHTSDGKKISTKNIISTIPLSLLGSMIGVKQYSNPVFVNYKFVYIEVEKKYVSDIYYVQDFDLNNLVYRSSNMGLYSNQVTKGNTTFVVAEIPYSDQEPDINVNLIKNNLIIQNILNDDCEVIDYKISDKKNAIPLNTTPEDFQLPKKFFAIPSSSFSIKNKLDSIDLIISNMLSDF